jgi:hypothetical protein
MNFRSILKFAARSTEFALALALFFVGARAVFGQVMSSSNYKIQSDSLNFGGIRSTSSAYIMEDTLGESASGVSSSTNYRVNAGYEQMQEVVLSVVPAGNVVMLPAIGGVTGGTSNGSTTFTVTTDDPAGYTVTIAASSSPALVSSLDSFADYVPAGANPDFAFANAAAASSFAFSPEGAQIAARFRDNGSACGIGASDTANACWDGLSVTTKTIAGSTASNQPSGTVTKLNFRAASGASHIQTDGTYTGTTTLTVIAL